MLVFLDFEASSLGATSYPIEVAWVFEDGLSESYLIRPAPGWDDWDPAAEAIHHIPREILLRDGAPHDRVAARMVAALAGHDLLASAPSWDGKWLSTLLRAAGLPRHSLRVRASDAAYVEAAAAALSGIVPDGALAAAAETVATLLELRRRDLSPAHRALPDAEEERQRWLAVRAAAEARAADLRAGGDRAG